MKNRILRKLLLLLPVLCLCALGFGQRRFPQTPPPPVPSAVPPAAFDVIILRNGDLVYGLVQEVGPLIVRYKRTDIPDGPIYMLDRRDIYAISYRNQLKEVLNPVDGGMFRNNWRRSPLPRYNNRGYEDTLQLREPGWLSNARDGVLRIGLGFFRGYSNVENAGSYESKTTFPTLAVGYDVLIRSNLRLGVQVAWGQHKFTRQDFNLYDSIITDATLHETVYALDVYARYVFTSPLARLQPYLMGGLGLHASSIRNEQQIRFMERTTQQLLVKSGSRVLNLGLLARAGADYLLNTQLRVFADAGAGPAVLQLGVAFSVR